MQQMSSDGLDTVNVNFDDTGLPENVRLLRPMIWHDETQYCVLLGPDPDHGVFGCGANLTDALVDWNRHVRERLAMQKSDDDVAEFIRASINASVFKIN